MSHDVSVNHTAILYSTHIRRCVNVCQMFFLWLIYMHSIADVVFTISFFICFCCFFVCVWLKRTLFIVRLIEVAWMVKQNCVCRMLRNPSQSAVLQNDDIQIDINVYVDECRVQCKNNGVLLFRWRCCGVSWLYD